MYVKRLIAFTLATMPLLVFSQTQSGSQIDQAGLRRFLDGTARDLCVETYTNPTVGDGSNLKKLTLSGLTVKEVCNCTVREMKYYISNELGVKFWSAIRNLQQGSELTVDDDNAYKQWNQRFDGAMSVCRNKSNGKSAK